MLENTLFRDVPKTVYQNIIKIKQYKKGQLIFSEGESCHYLGIILKGELRISTLTLNDRDYTINILHPNDIFGDTLLFSSSNNYLGDGICYKDSEIAFLSKEDLLLLLKDNNFLNNYLTYTAHRNALNNYRIKLLSQKSILDRILFYVDVEVKRQKTARITIPSKEKLAKLLNIPRPSLSRVLSELKEKGLIDYDRTHLTLLETQ